MTQAMTFNEITPKRPLNAYRNSSSEATVTHIPVQSFEDVAEEFDGAAEKEVLLMDAQWKYMRRLNFTRRDLVLSSSLTANIFLVVIMALVAWK